MGVQAVESSIATRVNKVKSENVIANGETLLQWRLNQINSGTSAKADQWIEDIIKEKQSPTHTVIINQEETQTRRK